MRPLLTVLAALWFVAAPAHAQEACTPVDATAFRAQVDAAHDALLDEDLVGHARALRAVREGIACLTGPVPPSALAQLFYEIALVRHTAGDPWQDHVTAALRADPGFARTFGPPEVKGYTPPPVRDDVVAGELPGVERWLDGRPMPARFDLIGPHVIQAQQGGVWTSAWVEDGRLPAWAAPAPVVVPPPEPEPAPVPVATQPAPLVVRPAVALRVHAGVGAVFAWGPAFESDVAPTETAARLWVPVELGLGVDVGPGWLRATGAFLPLATSAHVFSVDGDARSSRFAFEGALAGGGRIGIGHVGAMVAGRVPSRIAALAVGGVQVHESGLFVELRAGVNVTTAPSVEPTAGVLLTFAPVVWPGRARGDAAAP